MINFIRLILLVVLLNVLTSCAASKTDGSDEDKSRKTKTAKINAQLGMAYLEQHNVERAKQKLLLAIDEDPTIPEPWYTMAYFYEATGNDDMAQKYYLKAISTAPTRGDVQNNYGTYLCRTGHYRDSIQHFLLATQDPDYLDAGDAFENAGLCAEKIPDKTLAYQYFKRAVLLNPDRVVSLREMNKLDNRNISRPKSKMKTMSDYLPQPT